VLPDVNARDFHYWESRETPHCCPTNYASRSDRFFLLDDHGKTFLGLADAGFIQQLDMDQHASRNALLDLQG
jgi:hypothetical protein